MLSDCHMIDLSVRPIPWRPPTGRVVIDERVGQSDVFRPMKFISGQEISHRVVCLTLFGYIGLAASLPIRGFLTHVLAHVTTVDGPIPCPRSADPGSQGDGDRTTPYSRCDIHCLVPDNQT